MPAANHSPFQAFLVYEATATARVLISIYYEKEQGGISHGEKNAIAPHTFSGCRGRGNPFAFPCEGRGTAKRWKGPEKPKISTAFIITRSPSVSHSLDSSLPEGAFGVVRSSFFTLHSSLFTAPQAIITHSLILFTFHSPTTP